MCLLSDINQSGNDGIFYSRPLEEIENNITTKWGTGQGAH